MEFGVFLSRIRRSLWRISAWCGVLWGKIQGQVTSPLFYRLNYARITRHIITLKSAFLGKNGPERGQQPVVAKCANAQRHRAKTDATTIIRRNCYLPCGVAGCSGDSAINLQNSVIDAPVAAKIFAMLYIDGQRG